jgi:hypothetical protein
MGHAAAVPPRSAVAKVRANMLPGAFPRESGIGRSASLALGTASGSAFGVCNASSGAWAICGASCLLSIAREKALDCQTIEIWCADGARVGQGVSTICAGHRGRAFNRLKDLRRIATHTTGWREITESLSASPLLPILDPSTSTRGVGPCGMSGEHIGAHAYSTAGSPASFVCIRAEPPGDGDGNKVGRSVAADHLGRPVEQFRSFYRSTRSQCS